MERYNLMGRGEGSGRIAIAAEPESPARRDASKIPDLGQNCFLRISILQFSLPRKTFHARK